MMDKAKAEVPVPKAIRKLLKLHKSLTLIANAQKVQCSLTGHQMLCKAELIEAYVGGKRYRRLSSVVTDATLDPTEYKEILVPSSRPKHESQLFCKVTLRHINNLPHHIAKHIAGRRFQKAFQRWKQCKETGEVFKANLGRTKQRVDPAPEGKGERRHKGRAGVRARKGAENEDDDGDNSGDDDDNDSLSDLIPVEDTSENAGEGKPEGAAVSPQQNDSDYDVDGAFSDLGRADGVEANGSSVVVEKKKRKKIEKSKPSSLKIPKAKKAKQ